MIISAITTVLGNPQSLEDTLCSIKPFLSEKMKWFIKFSLNSSDDFIEKFKHPYIDIKKSNDFGIYDAINQSLSEVDADYYFFIGAGDLVQESGIRDLLTINAESDSPVFMGITWSNDNKIWLPFPHGLNSAMSCPFPGSILSVRGSLEIGAFNAAYKIAGDYDHLCRYVNRFGYGSVINKSLILFDNSGVSSQHPLQGYLEEELIRMRIWRDSEYRVYSRLLMRSAQMSSAIFNQIADAKDI